MAKKTTGNIYSVSKLTREIKSLLEETYPFIWVTGEISNYAVPASGHSYFSLKDQNALISAVMFKHQKSHLRFEPENGMTIVGMARLSLYEPRGSYQLIFEHLEPEGKGSLQVAFEQLKNKLSDLGYFDEAHKKELPFLPSQISILTSGTGAALRDVINVAYRRFPNLNLDIYPVKVQGDGSDIEIAEAIDLCNKENSSDLIILARGGGSLEDLASFNSEIVATAIYKSDIPIISGVGHETDFTIADFISDLRAPTPSAAAELAIPDKAHLQNKVNSIRSQLQHAYIKKIKEKKREVIQFRCRLRSPAMIIDDMRLKLDDLIARASQSIFQSQSYHKEKLKWLNQSLHANKPIHEIKDSRTKINALKARLNHSVLDRMNKAKTNYQRLSDQLQAFNPKAVLDRGYSISRSLSSKTIITNAKDVNIDDTIEIILSKGQLITKVEKING